VGSSRGRKSGRVHSRRCHLWVIWAALGQARFMAFEQLSVRWLSQRPMFPPGRAGSCFGPWSSRRMKDSGQTQPRPCPWNPRKLRTWSAVDRPVFSPWPPMSLPDVFVGRATGRSAVGWSNVLRRPQAASLDERYFQKVVGHSGNPTPWPLFQQHSCMHQRRWQERFRAVVSGPKASVNVYGVAAYEVQQFPPLPPPPPFPPPPPPHPHAPQPRR